MAFIVLLFLASPRSCPPTVNPSISPLHFRACRIARLTANPAPSKPVSQTACVASAATATAARSLKLAGISRLTFRTASGRESCVVPAVEDAGEAWSISSSIAARDETSAEDPPRPNKPATAFKVATLDDDRRLDGNLLPEEHEEQVFPPRWRDPLKRARDTTHVTAA